MVERDVGGMLHVNGVEGIIAGARIATIQQRHTRTRPFDSYSAVLRSKNDVLH